MEELTITFPHFEPITAAELVGKNSKELHAILVKESQKADQINAIFEDKCYRHRAYEQRYLDALKPLQESFAVLADAFYPLHCAPNPVKQARAEQYRAQVVGIAA